MLAAALLAGLLPAAPALAAPATCGGSGTVTTLPGTLPDGAAYEIQCPAGPWNGTLFLYSHGYVVPGSPNPAPGRRRPGHGRVDARPRLRPGRFLLRDHRLGDPAGAARPDRHPGRLRSGLRHSRPDGRVGPLARRHHHGRPDPALPGPVHRRAADVRRAVRRGGHLEHRAGRRVRLPAADRPLGSGRQHHRPLRQPERRPRGRGRRAADATGPGPAGAGGGARRHPGLVHAAVARAGGHRLRGPGGQPVQLGHPGGLPVHLRLPRRARGARGREPVLEHGRELFPRPGEVG